MKRLLLSMLRGRTARPTAGSGRDELQPPQQRDSYFYLGPDSAMTRLLDGHVLVVDPQDQSVAAHLIVHGYWESWISDVVARCVGPGDRVVEVGANFGYYTVAMARRVGPAGRVVAFEANPRVAALLQRTVNFNGYAPRVEVRPQAALDAPGRIAFAISRDNAGGGHAEVAPGQSAHRESVEVEAVRLDDVVPGEVDFIRIDAEGSEPLILRGAERLLASPRVRLCLEWDVHQMSSRASVPDFIAWLQGLGFGFWRIEHDSTLTPVAADELATMPPHDVLVSRSALTVDDSASPELSASHHP